MVEKNIFLEFEFDFSLLILSLQKGFKLTPENEFGASQNGVKLTVNVCICV